MFQGDCLTFRDDEDEDGHDDCDGDEVDENDT